MRTTIIIFVTIFLYSITIASGDSRKNLTVKKIVVQHLSYEYMTGDAAVPPQEVVVFFYQTADTAFGFKLTNDNESNVHQGMLSLLQEAMKNNYLVRITYEVPSSGGAGTKHRLFAIEIYRKR